MNNPDREQQKRVNDYFQSTLAYWDEIYREGGVYQTIYQRRRTVALSLVDKLALPAGSRVLEVGCAHGLTTVALAERGFSVEAVDAVPEMISAARIRAQESGLAQRMSFQVADIQNLPFEAGRFNLVLVIGVTEWLRSLEQPLREIERVLRPGGHSLCQPRLLGPNPRRRNHLWHGINRFHGETTLGQCNRGQAMRASYLQHA